MKDQGEPAISGISIRALSARRKPRGIYVTDADGHSVVATSINEVDINYRVEVTTDNLMHLKRHRNREREAVKNAGSVSFAGARKLVA